MKIYSFKMRRNVQNLVLPLANEPRTKESVENFFKLNKLE